MCETLLTRTTNAVNILGDTSVVCVREVIIDYMHNMLSQVLAW